MLEITKKADEMIKDFLKDKDDNLFVRIFLSQGGWSGPSLGLALDELKEDDQKMDENGVTYLINNQLFNQAKPINVDFVDTAMGAGFSISSNLNTKAGCGSSCSC